MTGDMDAARARYREATQMLQSAAAEATAKPDARARLAALNGALVRLAVLETLAGYDLVAREQAWQSVKARPDQPEQILARFMLGELSSEQVMAWRKKQEKGKGKGKSNAHALSRPLWDFFRGLRLWTDGDSQQRERARNLFARAETALKKLPAWPYVVLRAIRLDELSAGGLKIREF